MEKIKYFGGNILTKKSTIMKALFTFILLTGSIFCFSQSHELIALKTGDTLTVTKLELGDSRIYFKLEGQNKSMKRTDVEAYNVNRIWYDMITGIRLDSTGPVADKNISIMKNPASSNNEMVDVRNLALRQAGSALVLGTVLPLILTGAAFLIDSSNVQTVLLFGASVTFVICQIRAGAKLKQASGF